VRQRGAVLLASVHGDPRRVQIDRHRLAELTTERPVKPRARRRDRPLDPLAVHPAKALGPLQRRRRRGHLAHRPQRRPRRVRALVDQVIEERTADQLALRQTDHQLAGRGTPPANLHRPRAPLPSKLTIDPGDQPQPRL